LESRDSPTSRLTDSEFDELWTLTFEVFSSSREDVTIGRGEKTESAERSKGQSNNTRKPLILTMWHGGK